MKELSAHELNERAKEGSNKRLPFRYFPIEILKIAKTALEKTTDIEKVLRYILNSFYIYRESVCVEFLAPHYEVEGAFEWPKPSKFSWDNIEAVILGGEYIHGELFEKDEIEIESRVRDKVKGVLINPKTNRAEEYLRDFISGKDNLNETLKYRIENMSKVGFLFQMDWQNESLRNYANPMYFLLEGFLEGKIEKGKARSMLGNALIYLESAFVE